MIQAANLENSAKSVLKLVIFQSWIKKSTFWINFTFFLLLSKYVYNKAMDLKLFL